MRLKAMGQPRYKSGFEVTLQRDLLSSPLKWSQPKMIFVNSMSDLFHDSVPEEYIQEVFATMKAAHWHTFQVLTKRSERLADIGGRLPWSKNVWMGVSVESPDFVHRIRHLLKVPAAVRFLSVEPLLAPIPRLPLSGIDWVILGGESGPGCRSMEEKWVRDIRDKCLFQTVPFFFKQWGGVRKKATGRILDGVTWNQMPKPKRRHPISRKVKAEAR